MESALRPLYPPPPHPAVTNPTFISIYGGPNPTRLDRSGQAQHDHSDPRDADARWPTSNRNPGRLQIGIGGRLPIGMRGRLRRYPHVANMGATHFGCARFRTRALTSAGSPSSRLRPNMESHLSTDAPRQAKARISVPVGPPKKPPADISSPHQNGSNRLKRRTCFLIFGLRSTRTRSCQPNTIPPARSIARVSWFVASLI